ncbi:hypothetical protein V5799_020345 [Amblyomma americanum]|uniref:Uncharacterized protein n=1 Tax=Amblyomma americanum TaxID=6943 RepID=A0AAQ4EUA6_AMBAM
MCGIPSSNGKFLFQAVCRQTALRTNLTEKFNFLFKASRKNHQKRLIHKETSQNQPLITTSFEFYYPC